VLSIIALLVALLLPAIEGARAAARTTVCLANKRQVGVAVMNYANDWDFVVPTGRSNIPPDGTRWWHEFFVPDSQDSTEYLTSDQKTIACPEGKDGEAVFGAYDPTKHTADKAFEIGDNDATLTFVGIAVSNIPVPSDVMGYACTARWNAGITSFKPGYPLFGQSIKGPGGGWKAAWTPHHRQYTTGLFFDGHAAALDDDGLLGLGNAYVDDTNHGIRGWFAHDGQWVSH